MECWYCNVDTGIFIIECWYWNVNIGKIILECWYWNVDIEIIILECWYFNSNIEILRLECWYWNVILYISQAPSARTWAWWPSTDQLLLHVLELPNGLHLQHLLLNLDNGREFMTASSSNLISRLSFDGFSKFQVIWTKEGRGFKILTAFYHSSFIKNVKASKLKNRVSWNFEMLVLE